MAHTVAIGVQGKHYEYYIIYTHVENDTKINNCTHTHTIIHTLYVDTAIINVDGHDF